MDNTEDLGSQFVENRIDIQDEMPVPKEEIVDINADDSDLDIIEVHCNINSNKTSAIRKHIPSKFRRKTLRNNVNHFINAKQNLDVKEEIVISDSSDTEYTPEVRKQSMPSCSTRRNKESSLSSIILNCPKCNSTKTVYSTTLTSQCKECKVNMTFVCNECKQKYETLLALFRHKKIQCKKNLPAIAQFMHKCTRCLVKYKLYNLSKPRKCLKCKTLMAFECMICSKDILSNPVLYRHLKNQCQPRSRLFFCNDCSFSGNCQRVLLLHFSSCHQNLYKLNTSCDKCGKGFANYLTLNQHKLTCGMPYFYCKFCPYRPRFEVSLKSHLMIIHKVPKTEIETMMQESNCPSSYAKVRDIINKPALNKNNFVLKQLTEVTCTECNHTQPITRGLSKCNKCKKTLVYQCLYCPMRFRTMSLLQRHARRMHGKVEYVCPICSKPFSFFGDYNEHQKWCGKEPRFACQLCPFKTRYRHNLKGHMDNLHDKNRPVYVCQECSMGYKTEKAMNRHFEVGCTSVMTK